MGDREGAGRPAPRSPARRCRVPQRPRTAPSQSEYAAWYDGLPDNLRDTATAAALQAIVDLDFDELAAIVLPRGYGRD
jgi:hypothetical protein